MGGGKGSKVYGPVTTTGTGSAYVATIEDGPESLYTGLLLVIVPHTTSTSTTPTLNVNSLGAKSIYLYADTYTSSTYYPGSTTAYNSNKPLLLMYDGSYFRVLNFNEASWSNINNKPSSFTPSSHASSSTTYGAGTSTNYGHVRLGNNLTQSSSGQYALDAYQGKLLKDEVDGKLGRNMTDIEQWNESTSTYVNGRTGAEIFNSYNTKTDTDYIYTNAAIGAYSHAENCGTSSIGTYSHAEGQHSQAIGSGSHSEGCYTVAEGNYSHAGGAYTIANALQTVVGKYNKDTTGPSDTGSTSGSLFIVGNGLSSARSNAFRVANGTIGIYGSGSYHSSGADYAEHFEWLDGNTNNEDRRGLFVTLDGDKIKLANSADNYILGVISAIPTVVGDSHEDEWHGRYLKDIFGDRLTQKVHVEAIVDDITGETIEPEQDVDQYIQNPEYDPEKEYIGRESRKEWTIVGMMGKIVAVDDGTCEVNGYCYPKENGIATKSAKGYRVMKRLDDTHIQILLK